MNLNKLNKLNNDSDPLTLSDGGYYRKMRSTSNHPLFQDDPVPYNNEAAFDYLIRHASFTTRQWEIRPGSFVTVERGSVIYSDRKLSASWKWTRSKVKRFLKSLQRYGFVTLVSNPDFSIVRISNYDLYTPERDGVLKNRPIHFADQSEPQTGPPNYQQIQVEKPFEKPGVHFARSTPRSKYKECNSNTNTIPNHTSISTDIRARVRDPVAGAPPPSAEPRAVLPVSPVLDGEVGILKTVETRKNAGKIPELLEKAGFSQTEWERIFDNPTLVNLAESQAKLPTNPTGPGKAYQVLVESFTRFCSRAAG